MATGMTRAMEGKQSPVTIVTAKAAKAMESTGGSDVPKRPDTNCAVSPVASIEDVNQNQGDFPKDATVGSLEPKELEDGVQAEFLPDRPSTDPEGRGEGNEKAFRKNEGKDQRCGYERQERALQQRKRNADLSLRICLPEDHERFDEEHPTDECGADGKGYAWEQEFTCR